MENGAWLERNQPAQAAEILQLPWVADGIDAPEHEAALDMIRAARWYPDVFNALMEMSWVQDSVITADEAKAILQLRWSAHYSVELSKQMSQKPWVQDGITTAEADAMWSLAWFIREVPTLAERMLNMPWIQDDSNTETEAYALQYLGRIRGRNADAAAALAAMPFLESVEARDTLALESLSEIAEESVSDFRELMSHPRIKDGITDEETKIVAVLGQATYKYSPGSAQVLLAETGVYIEERLIQLPHTGETLLAVIRTEDRVTPRMDHFEHAVRTIEEFMGVPYPIDYLALLYYDNEMKNANNNFTHLLLMAEYDTVEGPRWHATVIAHEVAHWYWRSGQRWISEGSADFLRIISEHERTGRSLRPIKDPCPYFDNISELEKANPKVNPQRVCWYSLGQRFFLDLYLAVGDETFRPAFRDLYLNPTDDCDGAAPNICHVAAAFKDGASEEVVRKVDEIIARWYGPLP